MEHEIFYISPLTDFGFKKIFGDKVIMKRFLEVLFKSQKVKMKIQDLTYIPQEADGSYKDSRRVVYDVHCVTDKGEEIIVEMQNEDQYFWDKRIIYYLSRSTSMQGDKSIRENMEKHEPWNYDIKKVIGIFIMNFRDEKETDKVSRNCWMNKKTGRISSDYQEFWKIQLPFYRKTNLKVEDCKTELDYWLYNLANMSTMKTTMPFIEKDPAIKHMSDISYYFSMPYQEQQKYFHELDAKITYKNMMDKKIDTSRAEGRAKGLAEGIKEGSYKEKLETAQKMKQDNLPVELIIKYTGLTREEIDAIPVPPQN